MPPRLLAAALVAAALALPAAHAQAPTPAPAPATDQGAGASRGATQSHEPSVVPGAAPANAAANSHEIELPHVAWGFNGPFGTFDRASAQRGFQVYNEVCSNCHSMNKLSYRNLSQLGLSEEQIKALAASKKFETTDDTGQPAERDGLPSDRFKSPYPNEKASRAGNGGALPPDLSLINKAREGGADYTHALLNGYQDPPAGVTVPPGQYYNIYFPGHLLAMPAPLSDDRVTYSDGTKATVEQMSKDVSTFLAWAANPELEARKRMGVKVVLFLTLMTGLTYAVKRKVWKDVH